MERQQYKLKITVKVSRRLGTAVEFKVERQCATFFWTVRFVERALKKIILI